MSEQRYYYNQGGQRRTIQAPCGWRSAGHPKEVNGKFQIHKRYCKCCNESLIEALPQFNKTAGGMNGWKGNKHQNNQPNKRLSTAFVNGECFNIITEAPTLEKAMDEVQLQANLLAGNITEPVLSKSQKKRQKQKAKKEKHQEIIEGAMNMYIPSGDIDAFLETTDDKTEEELTYELAELLGGKMTEEELGRLIKALEK